MDFLPVISALVGATVGFLLGQVNRLVDRVSQGRAARSEAAELAISWAFRVAFSPGETWLKTLTDWSESVGPLYARFSSLRTKGSKYVVGYVSRELGGLIKARSNNEPDEALMRRAVSFRDELTLWVDSADHAHRLANKLK